jgi:hypothetical protein
MVIKGIPKQSPSDVMQIIKSIPHVSFSGFTLKLKRNTFGEVNCGLKVILLKRLEMLQNRLFENMFKTSYLN